MEQPEKETYIVVSVLSLTRKRAAATTDGTLVQNGLGHTITQLMSH